MVITLFSTWRRGKKEQKRIKTKIDSGNIKVYVPNPEDQQRLQEILDDKEGNGIRNSVTNYYANIKEPVSGWLNINYLNSDSQISDVLIPDEV